MPHSRPELSTKYLLNVITRLAEQAHLEPCLEPSCDGFGTFENGHCHVIQHEAIGEPHNLLLTPASIHDNTTGSRWLATVDGMEAFQHTRIEPLPAHIARQLAAAPLFAADKTDKLNQHPPICTGNDASEQQRVDDADAC